MGGSCWGSDQTALRPQRLTSSLQQFKDLISRDLLLAATKAGADDQPVVVKAVPFHRFVSSRSYRDNAEVARVALDASGVRMVPNIGNELLLDLVFGSAEPSNVTECRCAVVGHHRHRAAARSRHRAGALKV